MFSKKATYSASNPHHHGQCAPYVTPERIALWALSPYSVLRNAPWGMATKKATNVLKKATNSSKKQLIQNRQTAPHKGRTPSLKKATNSSKKNN